MWSRRRSKTVSVDVMMPRCVCPKVATISISMTNVGRGYVFLLFQVVFLFNLLPISSSSDLPDTYNSNFRLVQVLFRHGDRSPTHTYPTDPHQEDAWPQGFGQLTQTGMRQEYNLGQYLRKRYNGFLNSTYIHTEVRVRSTDYERTLMSAQTVLAGLYPPAGTQVWNGAIKWQPIPVHTELKNEDYLLYMSIDCPKFTELHDEYMKNNSWVNAVKKETKELSNYVSKNSGLPATFEQLLDILDPIFCEITHNLTLPDWLKSGNTVKQLMDLRVVDTVIFTPTPEMTRLRGGLLVGEMVSNMQNKVYYNNITEKMFVYSAHDTTVNALLNALGVFNKLVVPYTGCVMVELVEIGNGGQLGVQIYYRNDSTVLPYLLPLTGCSTPCPLDKFINLMKGIIPLDIKKECGVTNETCVPNDTTFVQRPTSITIALTVMVSLVLLIFIALLSICCLRWRQGGHHSHDTYKRVPSDIRYPEYKDDIQLT